MIVLDSSAAISDCQTWERVWLPAPVSSAEQRLGLPCPVLCLARGDGQQSGASVPLPWGSELTIQTAVTQGLPRGTVREPREQVAGPGAPAEGWEDPREVSVSSVLRGGWAIARKDGAWSWGTEAHGGTRVTTDRKT